MDILEVFIAIVELCAGSFSIFFIVILCKYLIKVPEHLKRTAEAQERTAIALERTAGALERKEHREIMDRNAAMQASKQNTVPQNQSQQ